MRSVPVRAVKSGLRARATAGALVILGAGSLAACGVPIDDSPRALGPGDVPAALSAGTTTSTTEAGPRTPGAIALAQVYFVSADRLVSRGRVIPSPATVAAAVGSLLAGPTATEAQAGIRSTIPSGTQLLDVHTTDKTATVDLSANFAGSGGPDQILAIAQVTDTVTSVPGVDNVVYELAGSPVDVPKANGTLVRGPVSATDYAALLAPGEQGPPPAGG